MSDDDYTKKSLLIVMDLYHFDDFEMRNFKRKGFRIFAIINIFCISEMNELRMNTNNF